MLIKSIRLKNLLSFVDAEIVLKPLNILIGANASGKSNLISAIELLKSAPQGPSGLPRIIPEGGGVRAWIWNQSGGQPTAFLGAVLTLPRRPAVTYELEIGEERGGYYIASERLFETSPVRGNGSAPTFIERTISGAKLRHSQGGDREFLPLGHETALSLFRDPKDKTPVTDLAIALGDIRIFHGFNTAPLSPTRAGVTTAAASGFLADGGENLAMVLQALYHTGKLGPLNEALRGFWEAAEEIRIRLQPGVAITDIKERGIETPTPGLRLSDGTLKFLCLMAVLLHPEPPPLICIEEPELGLHPDALTIVADALRDASTRCQVLVTTHSADLVTAFSGFPECVVVCENEPGEGTRFSRLKPAKLSEWLQSYRLGELWRMGEIGGNRW